MWLNRCFRVFIIEIGMAQKIWASSDTRCLVAFARMVIHVLATLGMQLQINNCAASSSLVPGETAPHNPLLLLRRPISCTRLLQQSYCRIVVHTIKLCRSFYVWLAWGPRISFCIVCWPPRRITENLLLLRQVFLSSVLSWRCERRPDST